MATQHRIRQGVLSILIAVLLGIGAGVLYFNDHAWGTWGDDSAGYIYLAGRLFSGESLVYHDPIVQQAYEVLQDERITRWLTPTHHFMINQQGVLASKYPIGASLLMYVAAKIAGSSYAFYLVNPLLAAFNITLVYWWVQLLFPRHRFRIPMGILSGVLLGVTLLYYDHALAQPMREIPSMTFLLLTTIGLMYAVKCFKTEQQKKRYTGYALVALAAASFGCALVIRETSAVLLPAYAVFFFGSLWKRSGASLHQQLRSWLPIIGVAAITLCVSIVPWIWNSYEISKEKEVFKPRDTSTVVVLSNIGHVESLSIENLFEAKGKYTPSSGSLVEYWKVMREEIPVPYFLLLAAVGIWGLWKEGKENSESRPNAALLFLWWVSVLAIFALWVNPYSRYILPLFPPLIIAGVYGIAVLFERIIPRISTSKLFTAVVALCIATTFIGAYQPTYEKIQERLHKDVFIFKAISRDDLDALHRIAEEIQDVKNDRQILMFTGRWQYGTSETFEAHTGIKTIRAPLEQRFSPTEQDATTVVNTIMDNGQSLFVWIDPSTQAQTLAWLEQYTLTPIATHTFSFQDKVTLYRVEKR